MRAYMSTAMKTAGSIEFCMLNKQVQHIRWSDRLKIHWVSLTYTLLSLLYSGLNYHCRLLSGAFYKINRFISWTLIRRFIYIIRKLMKYRNQLHLTNYYWVETWILTYQRYYVCRFVAVFKINQNGWWFENMLYK